MPNEIYGDKLGTHHLAANPQLYYPQTSSNFEFIVTGVDSLLRLGATESTPNPYITNAQQVIRYSVDASSVPSFEQGVITISRGNGVLNFADKPSFSQHSITINDYVGLHSLDVLLAWQRLSYNLVDQAVGRAVDYKKTCYLNVYDSSRKLVRTYTLYGCWVKNVNEDDYKNGQEGGRQVKATIIYDTFTMNLPEII